MRLEFRGCQVKRCFGEERFQSIVMTRRATTNLYGLQLRMRCCLDPDAFFRSLATLGYHQPKGQEAPLLVCFLHIVALFARSLIFDQ